MNNYFLYILLFCCGFANVDAQEEQVLITKNFKFNDGIFMSFEDFQLNRPTYNWEELTFDLFANPQTFITRVQSIATIDGEEIDLNQVWGLSIDGIPHIRLEKGKVSDELFVFVSIKVRGKICYFSYTEETTRMVTMKAYNPLTRQPFRTGQVKEEVTVLIEKMLDFNTGEIRDFNTEQLIAWIQRDDTELAETIMALPPEEAEEKLFKCLLIYVDRHAVYTNNQ